MISRSLWLATAYEFEGIDFEKKNDTNKIKFVYENIVLFCASYARSFYKNKIILHVDCGLYVQLTKLVDSVVFNQDGCFSCVYTLPVPFLVGVVPVTTKTSVIIQY